MTRAWSPALVLGLAFRRTRAVSALALLVPALSDWAADRQGLDPVRAVAVHVADDVAYGTGVWVGCAAGADARAAHPSRLVARRACGRSPALRHELRPAASRPPGRRLTPAQLTLGEAELPGLMLPVRRSQNATARCSPP